jgi:rRNA maturation protein Nop10
MIRKCVECEDYTLKDKHCGEESESTRPPKFSFPDKYGKYRRKAKKGAE